MTLGQWSRLEPALWLWWLRYQCVSLVYDFHQLRYAYSFWARLAAERIANRVVAVTIALLWILVVTGWS